MNIPKVRNMQSSNGNDVPNQFEIETKDEVIFQSYDTIIAVKTYYEHGAYQVILNENKWNYSRTTGRYRNIFLGEDIKEAKRKIESGIYKLANLN